MKEIDEWHLDTNTVPSVSLEQDLQETSDRIYARDCALLQAKFETMRCKLQEGLKRRVRAIMREHSQVTLEQANRAAAEVSNEELGQAYSELWSMIKLLAYRKEQRDRTIAVFLDERQSTDRSR